MEWEEHARCKNCKKIVGTYQFSSKFFMKVCPKCGEPNNMEAVIARLANKGVWYKPWTWLDEQWEIKEG